MSGWRGTRVWLWLTLRAAFCCLVVALYVAGGCGGGGGNKEVPLGTSCSVASDCGGRRGVGCCNQVCITLNDPNNCGGCGNACPPGEACAGSPIPDAPAGSYYCHGCIGSSATGDNTSCPPGQVCCNAVSPSAQCVPVDANNCGACGNKCPQGSECCSIDGKSTCTPPNDPGNCGGCGVACPPGQSCCEQTDSPIAKCANDSFNCGTCGNICTGSRQCCESTGSTDCCVPSEAGACVAFGAACTEGETCCPTAAGMAIPCDGLVPPSDPTGTCCSSLTCDSQGKGCCAGLQCNAATHKCVPPPEDAGPEGGADAGKPEGGSEASAPDASEAGHESGAPDAGTCPNDGGVPPTCPYGGECCLAGSSCVPSPDLPASGVCCLLNSSFTIVDPGDGGAGGGRVKDDKTGLVWARMYKDNLTWANANTFCTGQGLRLPTLSEAQGAAADYNTCAIGDGWNTWTTTEVTPGSIAWGVNGPSAASGQGIEVDMVFGALCVQ